jgi:hypothetical protein
MSHSHERAEKTCLNCGASPLHDRYCHHCGQENVVPRQTLWHLLVHFANDITHFDGKFFETMKMLLFKPGFLSAEYVKGRRTKYLDPIRMYLFISATFFLVFTSVFHSPEPPAAKDKPMLNFIDSVRAANVQNVGITFIIMDNGRFSKPPTLFDIEPQMKKGYKYYDSVQNTLPKSKKDDAIDRFINKQYISAYKAYDANPYNFIPNVLNTFLHSCSKVFFISLPIFSFFLYLLLFRRRKEYYYVSHAIFSIHYYCVAFLFLFLPVLCYELLKRANASEDIVSNMLSIMFYLIAGGMLVYLYVAMIRFYKQGWFKTLIKFILLSGVFAVTLIVLIYSMFMNSLAHVH